MEQEEEDGGGRLGTSMHLEYAWPITPPVVMANSFNALPFERDMIFPPIVGQDGSAMPQAVQQALLEAWIATILVPQIILGDTGIAVSPTTTLGMITQPTATWYAIATATIGSPWIDGAGNWHVTVSCPQFTYSGSSPSDTMYVAALVGTY